MFRARREDNVSAIQDAFVGLSALPLFVVVEKLVQQLMGEFPEICGEWSAPIGMDAGVLDLKVDRRH